MTKERVKISYKIKRGKACLALLCLALIIMFLSAKPVCAADRFIGIPVIQTVNLATAGSVPKFPVQYVLTPADSTPEAPLPEGASGDSYTFGVSGNDNSMIIIKYKESGDYEYELCAGTALDGFTLDRTKYSIKLHVNVDTNGYNSIQEMTMLNSSGEKVKALEFTHKFDPRQLPSSGDPEKHPGSNGMLISKPRTGDDAIPAIIISSFLASLGMILIIAGSRRRVEENSKA